MKWKLSRKVRIIGLVLIVLVAAFAGHVGVVLLVWSSTPPWEQRGELAVGMRFPFVYRVCQRSWGPPAITPLRQYFGAQGTYHRTDYDGDGIKEYAADLDDLYDWDGDTSNNDDPDDIGCAVKLVDLATAEADVELYEMRGQDAHDGYATISKPKRGYYFADLPTGKPDSIEEMEDKPPLGLTDGFALIAFPAKYGGEHKYSYIITNKGDVYGKDIHARWGRFSTDLLPDHVPDFEKDGWVLVEY